MNLKMLMINLMRNQNKLDDSYESPKLSCLFQQSDNIFVKEPIDKCKTQHSSPTCIQSLPNNDIKTVKLASSPLEMVIQKVKRQNEIKASLSKPSSRNFSVKNKENEFRRPPSAKPSKCSSRGSSKKSLKSDKPKEEVTYPQGYFSKLICRGKIYLKDKTAPAVKCEVSLSSSSDAD